MPVSFPSRINSILLNFGSLRTIQTRFSNLLNKKRFWKSLGSGSAAVGFSCFPLSPSSKNLLGRWNGVKIVIYVVVSAIFSCLVLFAKSWGSTRSALFKARFCYLAFMATSAYSFFQDKSKGAAKENGLGVVSYGAFAIMSLSLSRQIKFRFEVGVFSFFLGCVMVTALKLNFKLGLAAAAFCYLLIRIHSLSDSQDSELSLDGVLMGDQEEDTNANNPRATYDVFVSFRFKDSGNFTRDLVAALHRNNMVTYASDPEELPMRGEEEISPAHVRAIWASKVYLIIFSDNYACSRRCLEELEEIMDCQCRYGRIVMPVFYYMDPESVRAGWGPYAEAFVKHDRMYGIEKVNNWRYALSEAANLYGWVMSSLSHRSELVESIAEGVMQKLGSIPMQTAREEEQAQTFVPQQIYDVFLCDRGKDTRYTITAHLLDAFHGKNISVLNQGLTLSGEQIPQVTIKDIERCKILMIIFSKHFADSIFCLNEVEKIMECRSRYGQSVIPVFYEVDPSDVQDERNTYAEAFAVYDREFETEKVRKWRAALTEAANLSGWSTALFHGKPSEFAREIADDVLLRLNAIYANARH